MKVYFNYGGQKSDNGIYNTWLGIGGFTYNYLYFKKERKKGFWLTIYVGWKQFDINFEKKTKVLNKESDTLI